MTWLPYAPGSHAPAASEDAPHPISCLCQDLTPRHTLCDIGMQPCGAPQRPSRGDRLTGGGQLALLFHPPKSKT